MGDNLYTSYWQSILPRIIEQFKSGDQIILLPVTELTKYGDRDSYYTNFRIVNGELKISKNAYAQGRDLYTVLTENDYFKEYLFDRTIQITINTDLQLKIEILADSAPDFFTEEDFEQLNRFAKQTKDSANEEHQKTYDYLRSTYNKTAYWAREVQKKLFPQGFVQIIQKPTNQANKFEFYHWAKIYPDKNSFDFATLSFTVGIDTDNQFVVKIDTIGLSETDELRKEYIKIRGDYYNSKFVKILSEEQALNKGWKYLIDVTIDIITSLKPFFGSLIQSFQKLPESTKNPPVRRVDMSLNTIYFGPPGTGKTFTMQLLSKNFTISKNVQTREEYLEELIAHLTWWQTIAASLSVLKKTKVPNLEKHEFLKIKAKQSGTKNVKQIIWGSLQTHTDPQNEHVQVARRLEPFIFRKEENSVWTVIENILVDEVPEVVEFLQKVNDFKAGTEAIHKHYKMVTFHQNFSYEDFVEGIKPVFNEFASGDLDYRIEEGVFYQACNDAAQLAGYNNLYDCISDSKQNRKIRFENAPTYALFIDEINRANVSSVLGELITLIEDDKRLGAENEIVDTILPYSKMFFGVPRNLYIVATMNTADRSVEALDTALRRRFCFEPMLTDATKITESPAGIDISLMLTVINNRLEILLSKDHAVGHAWLMNITSLEKLQLAFKNKILPLLQEFFYNDYAKIGLVLGSEFVELATVKNNLFASFKQGDDLASEYMDKVLYKFKDPMQISIEGYKTIYDGNK